MHAMLSCIIASLLKRKPQHAFCAMPQPSQMRAGISCFCSTTLLGSFVSVHSSACSAQLLQSHRIQFWDHFLKIRGRAKAVLGAHALQLSSRSDQNHRCRFARQPLMGDLMVMLSPKLCNSSCLDSRCTPKNDPLFEDSEDLQNKGHMKSSLDGRLSTFSDSSFETVCLFCLLSARHENI